MRKPATPTEIYPRESIGGMMSGYHNFSQGERDVIFYTRVGTSTFAFVACLVALVVLCVFMFGLHLWTTFVHRLKLYLTVVALVLSVLYLLQVLPVKLGSTDGGKTVTRSWNRGCEAIVFLLLYTDWVMLLLICWLVVYLYRLARHIGQPLTISQVHKHHKYFEGISTALTLALPLLILWIPFVFDSYGTEDNFWCGMINSQNGNNNSRITGIGLTIGLWYIPAALVTIVCTVVIIMAFALFWLYYKHKGLTHQMSQAIIKGIPPIIYLILYNIINFIDISALIYHNIDQKDWKERVDYALSLVHAVTGPARAMIIPFAFVLSHFVTRACSRRVDKHRRDSYSHLN